MMNILKTSVVLILIIFSSCKLSTEANNESIQSFFTKTDWKDFNNKTLIEHGLNHFVNDNIDIFQREEFFQLMKSAKYNILYDDFYLIEIQEPRTERITSRKIMAIRTNKEIKYLFFKNSQECSGKDNFSQTQINKYKYENLVSGISKDKDSYIMVTKVIKGAY